MLDEFQKLLTYSNSAPIDTKIIISESTSEQFNNINSKYKIFNINYDMTISISAFLQFMFLQYTKKRNMKLFILNGYSTQHPFFNNEMEIKYLGYKISEEKKYSTSDNIIYVLSIRNKYSLRGELKKLIKRLNNNEIFIILNDFYGLSYINIPELVSIIKHKNTKIIVNERQIYVQDSYYYDECYKKFEKNLKCYKNKTCNVNMFVSTDDILPSFTDSFLNIEKVLLKLEEYNFELFTIFEMEPFYKFPRIYFYKEIYTENSGEYNQLLKICTGGINGRNNIRIHRNNKF